VSKFVKKFRKNVDYEGQTKRPVDNEYLTKKLETKKKTRATRQAREEHYNYEDMNPNGTWNY
jgi:hypothetical protein